MFHLIIIGFAALAALFALVKPNQDCGGGCNVSLEESPKSIGIAAVWSVAQIAGFTGDNLKTAVAIAFAESGGDPNIYNPEKCACPPTPQGFGSFGLWQIYLYSHPEDSGINLRDPQQNADAAFRIFSAHNSFFPWSTFKFGQYKKWLPKVEAYAQTLNAPCQPSNPAQICVQGQPETGGSPSVPCIVGGEG